MIGEAVAETELGLLVGEELFAVTLEVGVEREFVAAAGEGNGCCEFACADDAASVGLVRRVWNDHAAAAVGSESFQAERDAGNEDGGIGMKPAGAKPLRVIS